MNNEIKKLLGKKAAGLVQDGMVVGLGTGSTAKYFIEELGEKIRMHGLTIKGCASSNLTTRLAINNKIPLISLNKVTALDITVDGCDQFDAKKQLIKGKGGALLREKILAFLSKKYVIICTADKKREFLGGDLLPIEVLAAADQVVLRALESYGFKGQLRTKDQVPYVTDNQNTIIDLQLPEKVEDPQALNQKIRNIPGVIETGFFLNFNPTLIVGNENGNLETLS